MNWWPFTRKPLRIIRRILGYPQLTVAGRLPIVRNHDELDALIAKRHAKGDAARKGHETRRLKREGRG